MVDAGVRLCGESGGHPASALRRGVALMSEATGRLLRRLIGGRVRHAVGSR
ncbi:hypothetical protein [Embleya sp. NPDC020630]|uniref:hypothetical protein n=1 Tax=Embleya sp. NPDC020630 TaxID=3363979 RepID=UPI0037A7459E